MKKGNNGIVIKYLEEYSPGDTEILVVPIDDEGFIPYSKLRTYLRSHFWDSVLEARIQSLAGTFHNGDAYIYRNSNADLARVFSKIYPKYKSLALPYKHGHSVLRTIGTVPRGMSYSYYTV